ncbi:MAG: TSUP family transporter, partial [Actinomycetes bacterium]
MFHDMGALGGLPADPAYTWALAALAGATFVGACTQRITGLGFALVAAPFLSMVLGPFDGVLLVNTLGAVTSLLILAQVFKEVEYRRVLLMLVPALAAILLGSWVAVQVPAALLSILVGAMILIALTASVA